MNYAIHRNKETGKINHISGGKLPIEEITELIKKRNDNKDSADTVKLVTDEKTKEILGYFEIGVYKPIEPNEDLETLQSAMREMCDIASRF